MPSRLGCKKNTHHVSNLNHSAPSPSRHRTPPYSHRRHRRLSFLLCYRGRERTEPTTEVTGAENSGGMGRWRLRRRGRRRGGRPTSGKDPKGRVISATTRTDVAARLGELRDQILARRASFTNLAAQHSGCSSVHAAAT
uniref:Uncharacterized protein n=1 Tax=Aegilops tauschii subsp. strangulata TaxID=200361 RepID=A0A453H7I7_AEGTS